MADENLVTALELWSSGAGGWSGVVRSADSR